MLTRQLLVYRFDPGARFEGQLVGALERIESGGAVRVLDVLFVTREPESGELTAVSRSGSASGGMVGDLMDFRLDAGGARTAATERALAGPEAEIVRALAQTLEPGGAVAAVLVEHAWASTLAEAVARLGGTEAAAVFVEASRLSELDRPLDELT
jgi:hypothetical protein